MQFAIINHTLYLHIHIHNSYVSNDKLSYMHMHQITATNRDYLNQQHTFQIFSDEQTTSQFGIDITRHGAAYHQYPTIDSRRFFSIIVSAKLNMNDTNIYMNSIYTSHQAVAPFILILTSNLIELVRHIGEGSPVFIYCAASDSSNQDDGRPSLFCLPHSISPSLAICCLFLINRRDIQIRCRISI